MRGDALPVQEDVVFLYLTVGRDIFRALGYVFEVLSLVEPRIGRR